MHAAAARNRASAATFTSYIHQRRLQATAPLPSIPSLVNGANLQGRDAQRGSVHGGMGVGARRGIRSAGPQPRLLRKACCCAGPAAGRPAIAGGCRRRYCCGKLADVYQRCEGMDSSGCLCRCSILTDCLKASAAMAAMALRQRQGGAAGCGVSTSHTHKRRACVGSRQAKVQAAASRQHGPAAAAAAAGTHAKVTSVLRFHFLGSAWKPPAGDQISAGGAAGEERQASVSRGARSAAPRKHQDVGRAMFCSHAPQHCSEVLLVLQAQASQAATSSKQARGCRCRLLAATAAAGRWQAARAL